eukprot:362220-Chlamydomonas_euryale.AAC.13
MPVIKNERRRPQALPAVLTRSFHTANHVGPNRAPGMACPTDAAWCQQRGASSVDSSRGCLTGLGPSPHPTHVTPLQARCLEHDPCFPLSSAKYNEHPGWPPSALQHCKQL